MNREAVATAGDERAGDVVKARIAGEEGRDEAQISDKDAAFFEGVGNQAAGANCAGGGVEDDVALVNLRESGGGEGEGGEGGVVGGGQGGVLEGFWGERVRR